MDLSRHWPRMYGCNVRKPGHVVYTYLDTLRLDERRQPHPIDPQQEREFYLAGAPVASCLFEWRAGNAGTRLPRP